MDDRAFYIEKDETKNISLICPSCRGESSYPSRGRVRNKKKEMPRGMSEEDKKRFNNARSYMVRVDDLVACRKCRKRIELTGQSTVLISDALGDPNSDPENFGNR
jgi:hypothetical protein